MSTLRTTTALARPSIFSALVGPRIMLAPEDGSGGGGDAGSGGAADGGGAGDAGGGAADGAVAAGDAAAEKKGDGAAEPSALAGALAEKKDGDDKPAEASSDKGKEDKATPAAPKDEAPKDVDGNAIPDVYEIKMPDGVEMNKDLLAEVTPLFRDAKLSPAQAQVVADAYMKTQRDALQAHHDMVKNWRDQARKDPEVGGKDYEKHLSDAHKGFKAFGDQEALTLMDNYGLGDHPAILRLFSRVGKAIGEGKTIPSGDGGGRVTDGRALYPDMHK